MAAQALFQTQLINELLESLNNYYGIENWDSARFGARKISLRFRLFEALQVFLNKRGHIVLSSDILHKLDIYWDIPDELSWLYELLDDEYSKKLLVQLIAYRILGFRHVMLPQNNPEARRIREYAAGLKDTTRRIKIDFFNWVLHYFELAEAGFPVRLYNMSDGIVNTFFLPHYEYRNENTNIEAQPGDYVIDAGGCWGDSALYFAQKVGIEGKVFSFEFVPSNLEIMEINLGLNPFLSKLIEVTKRPLGKRSNQMVYYADYGPGTQVKGTDSKERTAQVTTMSIDDFVANKHLKRVDFIKMDIEGSELASLEGATNTIQTFKPRLAIAIYHNVRDLLQIPRFLSSLRLDYRFYINHFSIHAEETVLFAEVINH